MNITASLYFGYNPNSALYLQDDHRLLIISPAIPVLSFYVFILFVKSSSQVGLSLTPVYTVSSRKVILDETFKPCCNRNKTVYFIYLQEDNCLFGQAENIIHDPESYFFSG